MKTSCKYIEYGIHFDAGGIYFCSQSMNANEYQLPLVSKKAENKFSKFFEAKKIVKDNLEKNILPKRCEGCMYLENADWEETDKLKYIGIFPSKKCDLNCIYCSTHEDKQFYNSIEDIPVYDFLKELTEKDCLAQDCIFNFAGGEPLLNPEFDKIIGLITTSLPNSFIRLHTNALKYSPEIAELLSKNKANVIISLDCGNRDLYKQIKNSDLFDETLTNIKKYCQKQESNQVILKYIIIPNVNDKEENICEFIKLAKSAGCRFICGDLDFYWQKRIPENKQKEEIERIHGLLELFKKV